MNAPRLLERALDRAAGSRVIAGNAIEHLPDSAVMLAGLRAAIEEARERVHFENYIIRGDATGRSFADVLVAAARRGVTVRVIYDPIGCRRTPRAFWRRLRAGGVEVRAFNPPRWLSPARWRMRDHRKYVAVDGRAAVVGGFCIGDEWAGDPGRSRHAWRDTAVRICGPAVPALEFSFARIWAMAGPPIPALEANGAVQPCGRAKVRVIEGAPSRLGVYLTVELLAAGAAERLWITEAYLFPPRTMYASLVAAARDRVDVRLLLPGKSDIPAIAALARTGYRELLDAGVRVWEWRGPMLHAKTVLVDGSWFKVGSSNLNASSLKLNHELDLLIEDDGIAQDALVQFRHDLSHSVEIVLRPPRWARGPLAERVRRALPAHPVVTVRQVAAGARRSILGATVLALLSLGGLLLALPRFMAGTLAVAAFWLAGSAAWQFYRRRRETDE